MDEIKWLKLSLGMFDSEKIDFIMSLPEADAIIVVWIRLLVLAGKSNAGGYIILAEALPYNEDMLVHSFKKPKNVVRLALETFRKLGMIEQEDGVYYVKNWLKYQNVEGMELVKLQSKVRSKNYRERQKLKLLQLGDTASGADANRVMRHVTHHEKITLNHAIESERDFIDKELNSDLMCTGVDKTVKELETNHINVINDRDIEAIQAWLVTYSCEEIEQAIAKSRKHGAKYVSYITKMLEADRNCGGSRRKAKRDGSFICKDTEPDYTLPL